MSWKEFFYCLHFLKILLHKYRFWFQRRFLLLFLCLLCCILAVYFCISLNNSVLNSIVKMSKAELSSFAGMFVFIPGTPESAYCWVFCICSLQMNSDSVHVYLGMALHISHLPSVWFRLNSFFLFLTAAAVGEGWIYFKCVTVSIYTNVTSCLWMTMSCK